LTPFRIILVFTFFSVLGYALVPQLPLNFIPTSHTSTFTLSFSYPGYTPLSVEREVTSVLENELSQLEGLKSIRSTSNMGQGQVTLVFDSHDDLQFRQQEIYMYLRKLNLPREVSWPVITRKDADDEAPNPIIIIEATYDQLDEVEAVIQNDVVAQLASRPQVSQVQISGLNREVIHIRFDPDRLLACGLRKSDIISRIQEHAGAIDVSNVLKDDYTLGLSFSPALRHPDELQNIPLNKHLKLADVAEVSRLRDKKRSLLRIDGEEALFLSVYATDEANRLKLAGELLQQVDHLDKQFQNVRLSVNYNDSAFISEELDKAFIRAFAALIVIALFGLISYRSWKYLLVFSASIIINVGLVALASWLFALEVHLFTLAGIAISFGLLVDNSIIIIDDYRHRKRGKNLNAQLAASATTLAALLVILFLPAEVRSNLTDLVIIVSLALACSFLVSWFFIPAVSKQMHLTKNQNDFPRMRRMVIWTKMYERIITGLKRRRKWVVLLLVLAFGLPVYLLPASLEGQEWYNQTIGSQVYQTQIRPYVDRWLGGSSRLFYRNVYERSSYRTPEKTRLYLNARLPFGHTLEHMDQTIRKAEDYLRRFPKIKKFITRVHSGQRASITIEFDPETEKSSFPYVLKNKLIQRSLQWGGVDWSVYGVGRGFSNAHSDPLPNFRVTLKGYDHEKLGTLANALAQKLLAHKRIQEVNTNARNAWSDEKLQRYGFMPDNRNYDKYIAVLKNIEQLSYSFQPDVSVAINNELLPVFVLADPSMDLSSYQAFNRSFGIAGLNNVGKISLQDVPNAIYREERQYLRFVSFDYYGSYRFGNEYLEEVMADFKKDLPLGYKISKNQWSWHTEQEKRKYGILLISLGLILVVSIIFSERLSRAFMAILVVPLSYMGLFLTFAWGDFYFDQGGYAAFLFLTGLSVNAFFFIYTDYLYHQSVNARKPVLKAMTGKIWPVTLTLLSTCVGLVPFLIYGENEVFWFSLAVGTIGGLITSFLAVFLVLPLFIKD